jgi:hypothetical protein
MPSVQPAKAEKEKVMLVTLQKGAKPNQVVAIINKVICLFNPKDMRIRKYKVGDEVEVAVKRVVMARDVCGRPIPNKPRFFILTVVPPEAVYVRYDGFYNRMSSGMDLTTGEKITIQAPHETPLQYRTAGTGMAVPRSTNDSRDFKLYNLIGVTSEEQLFLDFSGVGHGDTVQA